MFNHGARHIYLASCRGHKALSPVDKLHLRDINNKGGDARAVSCDALSKTDMAKLIQTVESVGPLGGDRCFEGLFVREPHPATLLPPSFVPRFSCWRLDPNGRVLSTTQRATLTFGNSCLNGNSALSLRRTLLLLEAVLLEAVLLEVVLLASVHRTDPLLRYPLG